MVWLKAIAAELVGLFVEDAPYALAIVLWLATAGLLLPRLGLPPALPPVVLFAGLALILLWSATSRARKEHAR